MSSFVLHLLAMGLMLLDHMWATVIPGNMWMTCVGRMAYPIFAFLLAEGFFHTSDRKKYGLRLLLFAVLSEIPFNLMTEGAVFNPFHQNVIWSLLLSFLLMCLSEKVKAKGWKPYFTWPLIAVIWAVGSFIGMITFLDYFHYGVLMAGVFYVFRKNDLFRRLLQFAGLILINVILFEGMYFEVKLLGLTFDMPEQGLACLAIIPLCFYNGKPGPKGKWVKALNYGFYPVHMLILAALALWVL